MSSETSICNRALSLIGVQRITSLSEGTKQARECQLHYAAVRDELLQEFPWPFATRRQELSLLNESYVGWDYAYTYPSDCLHAQKIYNASALDNTSDPEKTEGLAFEIAQSDSGNKKVILTDEEDPVLIYTQAVTSPGQFAPDFTQALIHKMAAVLAVPLRQKETLMMTHFNLYQRIVSAAKANAANESNRHYNENESFLAARA